MTSTTPFRLLRPFLLAAALVTSVAATGCGTTIVGLCDEVCACTGCSNREFDDCVDDLEDGEDEAYDAGCVDEYDTWLACLDDEAVCHGDKIELDHDCGSELRDLARCVR